MLHALLKKVYAEKMALVLASCSCVQNSSYLRIVWNGRRCGNSLSFVEIVEIKLLFWTDLWGSFTLLYL